ncbi:MAG: helix-turn-helix domain-containing protein, partial [Desulfobaccales bacterium]
MGQEYCLREVSRLLGISEGRLRRWSRPGLVAPRRRPRQGLAFDFQGLVALRTVKRLRHRGVSLRRIKKCVDTLRRLHPELAEPLAQARIQDGPLGGGPEKSPLHPRRAAVMKSFFVGEGGKGGDTPTILGKLPPPPQPSPIKGEGE